MGKDFCRQDTIDRYVKLWDTETGACVSRFTSRKIPYCVKFNPDPDKQHLFVAGTSDKKIICVSYKRYTFDFFREVLESSVCVLYIELHGCAICYSGMFVPAR